MTTLFELLGLSALTLALLSACLLPPGLVIGQRLGLDSEEEPSVVLLNSILFSALFFFLFSGALFLLGMSSGLVQIALIAVLGVFIVQAVRKRLYAPLCTPSVFRIALVFGLLFFCAMSFSAHPTLNFRNVSGENIRALTLLPIDNIIPYNFSRYLVEDIPFSAVEVVPTWKAADRGPLLGVLNAALFVALGIEDGSHWLQTDGSVFFFFQCLSVFLNLTSLLVVWSILKARANEKVAWMAVLLLVSTFFFAINVVFSWPKLLMAAFFLAGMYLLEEEKSPLLAGLFLAGAYLSHNISVFYLLSLVPIALCYSSFARQNLLVLSLGFLLPVLPWWGLKFFFLETSSRLLYLHLFCLREENIEAISFIQACSLHLKNEGLSGVILNRVNNVLYPLNPFHAWESLWEHFFNPLALLGSIRHLTFYQLVYAVGVIPLFVVVFGARKLLSDTSGKRFSLSLLCVLGALLIVSSLLGCRLSTWNHQWVYPAFLLVVMLSSYLFSLLGKWGQLLFVLTLFINGTLMVLQLQAPAHGKEQAQIARQSLLAADTSPMEPELIDVSADFDGDGRVDKASFDAKYLPGKSASKGNWKITLRGKERVFFWGLPGAIPVPADYDGDGAADIAVFEPKTGIWHILSSSAGFNRAKAGLLLDGAGFRVQWGLSGDVPVAEDVNGDAKADFIVLRGKTPQRLVKENSLKPSETVAE